MNYIISQDYLFIFNNIRLFEILYTLLFLYLTVMLTRYFNTYNFSCEGIFLVLGSFNYKKQMSYDKVKTDFPLFYRYKRWQ